MLERRVVVGKLQHFGIITGVQQGVVQFSTICFREGDAVVSQDNVWAVTDALWTCCSVVERG